MSPYPYKVIVFGGLNSIPGLTLEEAKEYGFESNCRFVIINCQTQMKEFEYDPNGPFD